MIDQKKIEEAVKLFLEGIGEDISREGLKDTPGRIARMCEELYGGMEEDASVHLSKTFSVDSSEMVIEKDITFYSTCEHHILPFYGTDCGCADGIYAAKRRSCHDRGGAYVYDHAWDKETGQQNHNPGEEGCF